MKVYNLKFALTSGITQIEGRVGANGSFVSSSPWLYNYLPKTLWIESRQAAMEKALALKDAKIKSLEKQITHLKALDFKDIP